jgi:ATP-binding cassette subfamily F protein uup
MAYPLLTMSNIHLAFASAPLFVEAKLVVHERERLCIVGRNGTGKSTLMKIAAGLVEPDGGQRFIQPGTTLRYLSQEPDFSGFSSVRTYVEAGLEQDDIHHRAAYLLSELGLTGTEDPATLSGGEARRAALARALTPEPDILLLDEPTNHLDLPTIEWLEGELSATNAALLLISHDRQFLKHLSAAVLWIDRGEVRRLDRGFAHFETWRDQFLEHEETERHKLDRRISSEEHWLRYGVTARRKRNQGRLRRLQALRTERRNERKAIGKIDLSISLSGKSGKKVIEAKGISKSFGNLRVINNLSIRVLRGDRIGIVGPNGSGKTTLVNLMTASITPDAGEVILGMGLEMATLDQGRESLDPDETLRSALTGGDSDTISVNGTPRHIISYMKDFLFEPDQSRLPLRLLSGGERGRLMLARAFAQPSNLLVLDEPTNDLDLETLDLLQEMLAEYPGTALIVSHDRDFLDRVVTSTLVAEGEGRWRQYPGGYSDFLIQRGSQTDIPTPKGKSTKNTIRVETKSTAPVFTRAPTKLSYREKIALETTPTRISDLETGIGKLEVRLAMPDFYELDPKGFALAASALDAARAALTAAEDEWLALELKQEMIDKR